MALSMDIGKEVMKVIKDGMSHRQAAARFDISPVTAVRWEKRVETTGHLERIRVNPALIQRQRRNLRILVA
jgi:transposase